MGYKAGDKIAIKVNQHLPRFYNEPTARWPPCPQMLHAMLWQLVNKAGVPEADITIYDCTLSWRPGL